MFPITEIPLRSATNVGKLAINIAIDVPRKITDDDVHRFPRLNPAKRKLAACGILAGTRCADPHSKTGTILPQGEVTMGTVVRERDNPRGTTLVQVICCNETLKRQLVARLTRCEKSVVHPLGVEGTTSQIHLLIFADFCIAAWFNISTAFKRAVPEKDKPRRASREILCMYQRQPVQLATHGLRGRSLMLRLPHQSL